MLTGRTHRFSPVAHAIDDSGSLCGAKPRFGRDWVPNRKIPLNCPGCLARMSLPRYAFCETPTASSAAFRHIRRLGPEGMSKRGVAGGAKTLCSRLSGWDLELVGKTPLPGAQGICPTCVTNLRAARTGGLVL